MKHKPTIMARLVEAEQMIRQMLAGGIFKKVITYAGEGLKFGPGLDDVFSKVKPDEVIKILMP